jgi:hypothetical protein
LKEAHEKSKAVQPLVLHKESKNMNINYFQADVIRRRSFATLLVTLIFLTGILSLRANAQYSQYDDDPPGRVARLSYMQGSVSFEPAGESEWVQAVPNRPITTGDRLWSDQNSRAQVQLGSASVYMGPNTGFSFLNLDDRTVQIELSTGTIDVRIRGLNRDDVFEIDTPNQAFTAFQPGRYRIEASEDGNYTVVTIRDGEGEATGNGQAFTIRSGQRVTLSGTESLSVDLQQIGAPDEFDNWMYTRERRYENSRSAQYCSRDLVGYEDLDDYGDWRPYSSYGNVWFPRVSAGWAPYRMGHWAWIDPWGYTWVDDEPWGYAPFHYGRWAWIESRWGWIPGPREVRPVYAPALVAFVGGSGFVAGGTIGWFPLGPREVYVPSYRVSQGYVDRVNVTNTTINKTVITNVYNTTIVNKSTTISNVNYVNRNVQGAVSAVPQRAFATAQPVGRNAVQVNTRQLASAPVSVRPAVAPQREAVMGARANTANRVPAPPRTVANRTVIAKNTPPPRPPAFEKRQAALQSHPGQSVAKAEMQKLSPVAAQVKKAPPAKAVDATQAANRSPNRAPAAGERPNANPAPAPRPENQPAPNNRPEANRPENRPAPPPDRNARPSAPEPTNRAPEPNKRPEANRPEPNRPAQPPDTRNDRPNAEPNNRPNQPNERPEANRPENRPAQPPATRNNRPAETDNPPSQPPSNNRPEANRPDNRPAPPPERKNRPEANRPENDPNRPNKRPDATPPEERKAQPDRGNRPAAAPNERPDANRPNRPEENAEPTRNPRAERQNPPAEHPQQAKPATEPRPDRPPEAQQQRRQTQEERNRQQDQRQEEAQPPE